MVSTLAYSVILQLRKSSLYVGQRIRANRHTRFGGVKFSGFGREGSKYGISEYQIMKTVTLGGMGQPLQGS